MYLHVYLYISMFIYMHIFLQLETSAFIQGDKPILHPTFSQLAVLDPTVRPVSYVKMYICFIHPSLFFMGVIIWLL
jgi:hypothetical protein